MQSYTSDMWPDPGASWEEPFSTVELYIILPASGVLLIPEATGRWNSCVLLSALPAVLGTWQVTEGLDVLAAIDAAFVDAGGRPLQNVRIRHTIVLDDPFDDPPQLAEHVPDASPVPVYEQARPAGAFQGLTLVMCARISALRVCTWVGGRAQLGRHGCSSAGAAVSMPLQACWFEKMGTTRWPAHQLHGAEALQTRG